ncbi:MAG: serine/threonine protein kinase [Labilithrix sp.]|nr:serine/threonine protein kinase [Labilithrix sp.]
MGEVYRATDTRLHRTVALKVLRTDADGAASVMEAGGAARLLREARTAAALNHANSVAIYELGEAEGIPYIAMEFVQGASLRRYIGDANVSVETKVMWLVDAARALWAAHKAGVIHRDVKPGNIMVSEEGVVKVLDFGLAKPVSLDKSPAGFQTQMGQVLGTPRYMSPEQLEGAPADAAADQFAFGITAYEVISGTYPGGALAGTPTPLDECTPGATAALAKAVGRMMARRPQHRFSTMEEAAHELRASISSLRTIAAGSVAAPPPSAGPLSEAPTRPVTPMSMPEPESREITLSTERAIDKGKTLPLAVSMPLAVGAAIAEARAASAGSRAAPGEGLNRTLPLGTSAEAAGVRVAGAAPTTPANALSSDKMPAASGVYASKPPASTGRVTPAPASHPTRTPRSHGWTLIVVIALFVAAAGGVAAWLLR